MEELTQEKWDTMSNIEREEYIQKMIEGIFTKHGLVKKNVP